GLGHLPTMLALSLFIAIVATLSRMYHSSEMTIWFASGVSLTRFVRPVLRTSWPVLLVIALLALFAWPWQNRRSAELRDEYDRRSDLSRIAPGQFQTSADGQRTLVFAGANVMLLGVGMSASNPRHASNWNLLFALFGFFAYYNFINLSQSWVASGRSSVGAALFLTHGSVFALGVMLLWWREHGTNRGVVSRRRARPRPLATPGAA